MKTFKNKTVDDFAGFNFIQNPFKENTHVFECFDGIMICESPEPDSRFKWQRVIRRATDREVEHHSNVMLQRVR